MTPQEISARLIAIHSVIVDRFDVQPFLEPSLWVQAGGKVSVSLYRDYNSGKYDLGTLKGDTFEEALDAADAFVAALPPINEARRRYDEAREIMEAM